MCPPRRVAGSEMVLVTRRIMWREYRLVPSKKVNAIMRFNLFRIARKYGIEVCAVIVMSNHWHAVLRDRHGNRPEFMRDFHAQTAKQIGAASGEAGGMWNKQQTDVKPLVDDEAVLIAIAYTVANPVIAGAVAHGRSWPGVRMVWPREPRTIARPKGYFRDAADGGVVPAKVVERLHRPSGFDGMDDEQLANLIAARIEAREASARAALAAAGRCFAGRRAVLRTPRHRRATGREQWFRPRERFIATSRERRAAVRARDRQFVADHAAARREWLAGNRDVQFPHGTYKMRVQHRVNTAPPPV